jgi:hypothetical protein
MALDLNNYILENFKPFNQKLTEDEANLQFERFLSEEFGYPSIIVGIFDKKKVSLSESIEKFKIIAEKFGFDEKIVSVNANPNSKIKSENKIYIHEKDSSFLLDLEIKEESIDIVLKYNKFLKGNPNRDRFEKLSEDIQEFFLEENMTLESFFKNSKYSKKFEEYERAFNTIGIDGVNLLKVFDENLISMMERRFEIINNKEYYTIYKKANEEKMLMKHLTKLYKELVSNKRIKDINFYFSMLLFKGQSYPLLVAVNPKLNRIIGVYCFIMKPSKEDEHVYYLGKAEIFHSPLNELKGDILKLRKILSCSYFN